MSSTTHSVCSHTSSYGATSNSSHTTASSSSSRRRRRGLQEPRMPPKTMTSYERLTLVRNATTRLHHTLEKLRHVEPLDRSGGEAVPALLDRLEEKVALLACNPRKIGTPEEGGAKSLSYIAKEAAKLKDEVADVLTTTEADDASALAVYKGLKSKHLREVLQDLNDLITLISSPAEKQVSRVNTGLLGDQVAFHINEFDALFNLRLPALLEDVRLEGFFAPGAVKDDSTGAPKTIGTVSFVLLDVAVGVRPGRCARAVIHNARRRLEKVNARLHTAMESLKPSTLTERRTTTDPALEQQQQWQYTLLEEKLTTGIKELDALRARWYEEEKEIFEKALNSKDSLDALMTTKQFKEKEVIEEAQLLHDRLVHEALPFASPQYHRLTSGTYATHCMARLGLYLIADRSAGASPDMQHSEPLTVYTFHPLFDALMQLKKIPRREYGKYEYLAPSEHQKWCSFSEFPEMVRASRCALRGVNTDLDHVRALEEQKELGGYFIIQGGERILRALIVQRSNIPLNIQREQFKAHGPGFTSKGVVIRCKRLSGLTCFNYLFYSTRGEITFSFSRRLVWHVPLTLLLFATATNNPSSADVMRLLTIGMETSPNHEERVQMLLQHHERKPYSKLFHYVDYLAVIGRMYKEYEKRGTSRFLSQFAVDTECHHDAWYGLFMIRHHILPHLNVRVATPDLPPTSTPEQLAQWLPQALRDELDAKFEVLLTSARQLYLFNDGQIAQQGSDVPAYQEVFTSSQVLVASFWNAMIRTMRQLSYVLASHMSASLFQRLLVGEVGKRTNNAESIGQLYSLCGAFTEKLDTALLPIQRLLMLGNIVTEVDIDFNCPQPSGWVVQAEHLNFYRFFEQLRCVHRGSTIANMRSSEVRRYPCEAYGFLCMVHTPDGEDCGVLNHLSVATILSESMEPASAEEQQLAQWVAEALPRLRRRDNTAVTDRLLGTVPVWLDGRIIGHVSPEEAVAATAHLRRLKLLTSRSLVDENGVVRRRDATPLHTIEVVNIPPHTDEMAGLFIFSDYGRLVRPIQKIETTTTTTAATSAAVSRADKEELPFPLMYTGTWEQSWLDIAGVSSELADAVVQLRKKFEFMEQNGSNIISLTSTTIPFFEFNCSPRNLFQCGLSKQSTGTQLQSLGWRREPKLFRMYVPQRYISRTLPMDYYGLDDVSLGVNAVVAILAYTGYDMDDAVILNSTASQRGMLHAGITVGKIVTAGGGDEDDGTTFVFNNMLPDGERFSPQLEANGLPPKRTFAHLQKEVNFTTDHSYPSLRDDSDVYCVAKRCQRIDPMTNNMTYEYSEHNVKKWAKLDKGENAWVHQIIPLAFNGPDPVSVLMIFRIPRPPTVGDKFSSRHGQKGTLPLHIRSHDLPFSSQTGITPDVIINPHAFPSRMTVGMVLEIMTAKVGAVEGRFMDNSAWSVYDETPRVAETIGEALVKSGYNRYGREKFVDGISGEEMEADVFVGISGYQRLRHMVSDKWQARARTDTFKYRAVTKTGQPVKGRKRHGGVRIGEMERDALLSYGMSEVVLDRLLHVSDKTKAFVCTGCGSLLSIVERHATNLSTWKCCTFCGAGRTEDTDNIAMVEVPQVLRLWVAELTSIGIRVALRTEP